MLISSLREMRRFGFIFANLMGIHLRKLAGAISSLLFDIAVYEDDLETSFLDMDIQFSSVPPDIGDVAEDLL